MKNLFCALVAVVFCKMAFATPPLMVNLLAKHKRNPVSMVEGFSSCDSVLSLPKLLFSVPLKDGFLVIRDAYAFDRIPDKSPVDLDKTRGTELTTRLSDHNAFWYSSHTQHSVDCNRYTK